MFQSPSAWKEIIGNNDRIEHIKCWEMDCFEKAWEEWFSTKHKYALGDKKFYNTLIKPFTCFVGIYKTEINIKRSTIDASLFTINYFYNLFPMFQENQ